MKRYTQSDRSVRPVSLLLCLTLGASLLLSGISVSEVSAAPNKVPPKPAAKSSVKAGPAKKATTQAPATAQTQEAYAPVTPVDLLKDPKQYLNKKVTFEGVFSSFSSLGLDYKKALRDSKEYVSFLIRRPDVSANAIPLSELKLIFPRKKSDEVMKLEAGDKISIKGQVFSTALNEPWLDVSEVKVLEKVKNTKNGDCVGSDC